MFKFKYLLLFLIILISACDSANRHATVYELECLNLRVDINEYLRDQANRPGSVKSIRWDAKTGTVTIDVESNENLLQNWPTGRKQLLELRKEKIYDRVKKMYEKQKDTNNQAESLSKIFENFAKKRLDPINKDYKFTVNFYRFSELKPFYTYPNK